MPIIPRTNTIVGVIGKHHSGKTRYLYRQVRRSLDEGPKKALVVLYESLRTAAVHGIGDQYMHRVDFLNINPNRQLGPQLDIQSCLPPFQANRLDEHMKDYSIIALEGPVQQWIKDPEAREIGLAWLRGLSADVFIEIGGRREQLDEDALDELRESYQLDQLVIPARDDTVVSVF